MAIKRKTKRRISRGAGIVFCTIIYAVLFLPIVIVVANSFNGNTQKPYLSWGGFSLRWYRELFRSPDTFVALRNTLILAVCSSALATVIGTAAAAGIHRMKNKVMKKAVLTVTNVPMMNPDIVTGMSMMLFFVAVVGILGANYDDMGFIHMLLAHTTFCLPYVILSVLPRVEGLGKSLTEAALDLGCTPVQSFFKVELPNILPGVLSGFVMAFTLSLDDFVISYFVGSSSFQTLPLLIYSMTKKKVTPDMYALSTLVIITVFALLIFSNVRAAKEAKKEGAKKA